MKTNVVIDTSPPIPYLANFWFSSYGAKCCQAVKLQDSLNLKKEGNDVVYFWHADKHRSFPQVDTFILGVNSQTCPEYPK